MPVCAIQLLSLKTTTTTTIPEFLAALKAASIQPLVISRVIRWIILPTSISTTSLLAKNIHWDLLLILPPSLTSLPPVLHTHISNIFTIHAGIPSSLLQNFSTKNHTLLHPPPSTIPPLSSNPPQITTSSQDLTLSTTLQSWISSPSSPSGAISMLNLLSFAPNKKPSYLIYGKEFARSIGSKRGGEAKIVGSIVHGREGGEDGEGWDEVALAHYPSLGHFADMLGSEDYQRVNMKYRVPSLRDTLILCTSELGLDGWSGEGEGKAKL